MNLFRMVTVTLAAATLAGAALSAHAQAPAVAVPPAEPMQGGRGGARGGGGGIMGRRMMENLTPEEQTRLQAARRATARDPAVVAARRALLQAEREAMLKQDPTLGPVLEKLRPGGGPDGGASQRLPGANRPRPSEDNGRALAMLTPDERTRLTNAQRAARQDPAVVSARQAMQSATTPEARRAARQSMQEALRAAMLRADVGIDAIMEKVGRGAQGKPGQV